MHLARHRESKKLYAVKEISKSEDRNLESFLQERELLMKFSNIFVLFVFPHVESENRLLSEIKGDVALNYIFYRLCHPGIVAYIDCYMDQKWYTLL